MTPFDFSAQLPAALIAHALAAVASLASSRHAAWCRRIGFVGFTPISDTVCCLATRC
jgi:hypothetical protein